MLEAFHATHRRGENRAIERRRQQDDLRLTLQAQVTVERNITQHTAWEQQSAAKVRQAAITRHAHALMDEDKTQIEQRRKRLRDLLEREEEQMRGEIATNVETSGQRAKRLIVEARKHKAERERRREEFAADAYERQWKESCDELRSLDSSFFKLHCHDAIVQQVEHNKLKQHVKKDEERQWAIEWEQERQKQIKQQDELRDHRKEETRANRESLREQMREAQERQRQRDEQTQREREFVQQRLAADAEAATKRAEEEYAGKIRANRENSAYNAALRAERAAARDAQRAEDKSVLNEVMREYEEDQRKRASEKEAQRRDMKAYAEYLQRRKNEEEQKEVEMERLVREEVERENQRRERLWENDRRMRERLLQDVLVGRGEQMRDQAERRRQEAEERRRDRERIEAEIQRVKEWEREQEEQERLAKLERKQVLDEQIEENRHARLQEEENLRREKLEKEEADRQLQERLQRYTRESVANSQAYYGLSATRAASAHTPSTRLELRGTKKPTTQQPSKFW